MYRAQPALVCKAIYLDIAGGTGRNIYLWSDRAAPEAFYATASVKIVKQTGFVPHIVLRDVDVLVDRSARLFTRP